MRNEDAPHGGEQPGEDLPPGKEQGLGRAVLLDEGSGEGYAAPEGFAGYALHDPLGRKIGEVEQLFVNGRGEAEYVVVKIGSFWQKKSVMIPVEFVSVEKERRTLVLR